MNTRRLRCWSIELCNWLAEGKLIIMCLLVIVMAIILGFVLWKTEFSIRLSGYMLQFIGMVFAIRGLLLIREHFEQPLLRDLFIDWCKRFPKWKRSVVVTANAGSIITIGGQAKMEQWTPDDPSELVEERIARILRNLDRIRNEQYTHSKSIDELRNIQKEQEKKANERTEKIQSEIRTNLENLHTGDLITSLVGLIWLLIGITMSTLAPELSQLAF